MKLAFFIIGALFAVLETQLYVLNTDTRNTTAQFGAAFTQTASSDTLNTLRANVNQALNDASTLFSGFSTTTNNTFTGLNQFGNASSTKFSAGISFFGTSATSTFSAAGVLTAQGIIISSAGSQFHNFVFGTTTLIGNGASVFSVNATTTKPIDFTCTGVTNADQVRAYFVPTTTISVAFGSWYIAYAQASTTAGTCTAYVVNNTGATATIPQGLGSTTGFQAFH